MNLKIAIRNVFRNRVRSLITLAAIAFGSMSLIIAGGFFEDTFMQMREAVIHSHLGHIQIYKKGFIENGIKNPYDYLIDNPEQITHLISTLEDVKLITPRISFSGLLSTGENTISVFCEGIEPEGEKALAIVEGIKGATSGVAIQEGENLSKNHKFDLIIGRGLSKAIASVVGNTLILLTNTVGGSLNALDLNVRGVFYTASKEFDDRAIRVPITTAQMLLRTDKVQTLVVMLNKTANTERVKTSLERLLKEKRLDLEFRTWRDMADFYNKTVELYTRQFFVLKIIIMIIVILSIFNTINMAIRERTREIGTIMAMGYKKHEILKMFMTEGLILGVVGGLIGIILGSLLAYTISLVGIPMPPPPGATVGWIAMIKIVPHILGSSFFIAVVSSLISSFFPAYNASRLLIADALRHI